MKVFISYAREDKEFAEKLYNDLIETGIDVWMDIKDILPGQNWDKIIREAIQDSSFFLALLSSNSITKRGYIQKELKLALDVLDEFPENEIFIIPVRLDDSKPKYEALRKLHWVDLFPSYEIGLKKIINAIQVSKSEEKSSVAAKLKVLEMVNIISNKNQRWKDLNYTARGDALFSYNEFLNVNKLRDYLSDLDKDELAYLLRCSIQNGMGGEWGRWLRVNKDNEKIVTPLVVAINGIAGWRPMWRSAYVLEKIFGKDILVFFEKFKPELVEELRANEAIQAIVTVGIKKRLTLLSIENHEKSKAALSVLDEIYTFSKEIEEFSENQIITDILMNKFQ